MKVEPAQVTQQSQVEDVAEQRGPKHHVEHRQLASHFQPLNDDSDDDSLDFLMTPIFTPQPSKRQRRSSVASPSSLFSKAAAPSLPPSSVNRRSSAGPSSRRKGNLTTPAATPSQRRRVTASRTMNGRKSAALASTPSSTTVLTQEQREERALQRVAGLSLHLVDGVEGIQDLAWCKLKNMHYPVRRNVPADDVIGLDIGPKSSQDESDESDDDSDDAENNANDSNDDNSDDNKTNTTTTNNNNSNDTAGMTKRQQQLHLLSQVTDQAEDDRPTLDQESLPEPKPATPRAKIKFEYIRHLGHSYKHAGEYGYVREAQLEPIDTDLDNRLAKYERHLTRNCAAVFSPKSVNLMVEIMVIRAMIDKAQGKVRDTTSAAKRRTTSTSTSTSSAPGAAEEGSLKIQRSVSPGLPYVGFQTPPRKPAGAAGLPNSRNSSAKRKRSDMERHDSNHVVDNDNDIDASDDDVGDDDINSVESCDVDGHTMHSPDRHHKTERLRPGDIIEYYDPSSVFGAAHAFRQTTILGVRGREKLCLVLENGDVLPREHLIRRTHMLERGKLIACDGATQLAGKQPEPRRQSARQRAMQVSQDPPDTPQQSFFQAINSFILTSAGATELSAGMQTMIDKARQAQQAMKDDVKTALCQMHGANPNQGGSASVAVPAESDRKQPASKAEMEHAQLRKVKRCYKKQLKAAISNVRHCQSTKRRFVPHMTVSRLDMAIVVCNVMPSLEELGEATDIATTELDYFLRGDPKKMISQRFLQDIEEKLDRWLTVNGHKKDDGSDDDEEDGSNDAGDNDDDKTNVSAHATDASTVEATGNLFMTPSRKAGYSALAITPTMRRTPRRTARTDPRRAHKRARRSSQTNPKTKPRGRPSAGADFLSVPRPPLASTGNFSTPVMSKRKRRPSTITRSRSQEAQHDDGGGNNRSDMRDEGQTMEQDADTATRAKRRRSSKIR